MSRRTVTTKAIVLIFALCALCDFVWGYIHKRSVLAGVVWVVLGLPATALLGFLFGAVRKK